MRPTKTILLLVLLAMAPAVFAQQAPQEQVTPRPQYNNSFRFSMIKMLGATMELSYERAMGQGKYGLVLTGNLNAGGGNISRFGFGSELMYRMYFHPLKYVPRRVPYTGNTKFYGMYFGPFLKGGQTWVEEERFDVDVNGQLGGARIAEAVMGTVGGGAVLGLQWAFGHKVIVDINMGGVARYSTRMSGDELFTRPNVLQPHFTGVSPRFDIQFGFAF